MSRCVNQNCNKDPHDSPNPVLWGCDGDFCCSQLCYNEARKQMDHFCSVILTDDQKFVEWWGIPV